MDLLETVLRASEAEKYIETFRDRGVEALTLPLLKEEDLRQMGVEENLISVILKNVGNLQIPSEKKIDLVVNKEYAMLILNQISQQMYCHFGNLSVAVVRKDLVVCGVDLQPATESLIFCLKNLEETLERFELQISPPKKNKSWKKGPIVVSLIAVPIVSFFIVKRLMNV